MLSTMKSIILIALTTMLTIANTKAYPSPEDNFHWMDHQTFKHLKVTRNDVM